MYIYIIKRVSLRVFRPFFQSGCLYFCLCVFPSIHPFVRQSGTSVRLPKADFSPVFIIRSGIHADICKDKNTMKGGEGDNMSVFVGISSPPPPPMELDKGAEVGLWPRPRETREKLSFLYFTMSLCKFCTTWKINRKEIFKYWILPMVEFSVAVQLHLWLVRRMMIWYYSTFKNIYLALDIHTIV